MHRPPPFDTNFPQAVDNRERGAPQRNCGNAVEEVRRRALWAVRQAWPRKTAPHLAAALGLQIRQAEYLLSGKGIDQHVFALCQILGTAVSQHILAPLSTEPSMSICITATGDVRRGDPVAIAREILGPVARHVSDLVHVAARHHGLIVIDPGPSTMVTWDVGATTAESFAALTDALRAVQAVAHRSPVLEGDATTWSFSRSASGVSLLASAPLPLDAAPEIVDEADLSESANEAIAAALDAARIGHCDFGPVLHAMTAVKGLGRSYTLIDGDDGDDPRIGFMGPLLQQRFGLGRVIGQRLSELPTTAMAPSTARRLRERMHGESRLTRAVLRDGYRRTRYDALTLVCKSDRRTKRSTEMVVIVSGYGVDAHAA